MTPRLSSRQWRRVGITTLMLLIAATVALWLRGPGSTGDLLSRLLLRRDSTWDAMQARGTWRVGMDPSFPPFEGLDDNGVPVGYDVDLARAIAAQWGLEAEIITIGYDSLLDALMAGRVDSVVSALPYDARATRDYRFSDPYFEAGIRMAVRPGAAITTTAGLNGQQVAVEWGSMGDMVGRRLQREGVTLELIPYQTPTEAVDALVNDPAIAALLIDQVSLREAQGRGAAVIAVGPALESNPYVIASPFRANTLAAQIAMTLEQFQADGTLAELETRWFGAMTDGVE